MTLSYIEKMTKMSQQKSSCRYSNYGDGWQTFRQLIGAFLKENVVLSALQSLAKMKDSSNLRAPNNLPHCSFVAGVGELRPARTFCAARSAATRTWICQSNFIDLIRILETFSHMFHLKRHFYSSGSEYCAMYAPPPR